MSVVARLRLAIVAGGALGALARAGLVRAFPPDAHAWPWPTFAVNILGTALLGYFATRLGERLAPSTFRRPLLGTGFCGAYTTFSSVAVDTDRLTAHGHAGLAAGYVLGSLFAGLAAMVTGIVMARSLAASSGAPR